MVKEVVLASIKELAFACPHCGAFARQYWSGAFATDIGTESALPEFPDEGFIHKVETDRDLKADAKNHLIDTFKRITKGEVFYESRRHTVIDARRVHNVFLSQCYACDAITIWVNDHFIYPPERTGVAPNKDLPPDVVVDYEEARSIVAISPRGAAALLRLCIQKLCKHLGESGKDIDKDIGNLVKKGLSPLVQKSLDIVRVIGNESVHPGQVDMRDNQETATQLFGLVNLIAEQMISHPKHVDALYETLPASKREAIEKRDGKV